MQAQPHLKMCVRTAVERAVQEVIQPAVERAIKIALTTCEQIVRKDFALDPEEFRMQTAAHHMVNLSYQSYRYYWPLHGVAQGTPYGDPFQPCWPHSLL